MTDRSATAKFATMQSHALNVINETGGDWVVLRTKWTWSATVADTRNWVESVVVHSGLGVGTSLAADLEQGALREDSPDIAAEADSSPEVDPFAILPTTSALGSTNPEQAAVEPAEGALDSVAGTLHGSISDKGVELVVVEQSEYVEFVRVPETVEAGGVPLNSSDDASTSEALARGADARAREVAERPDSSAPLGKDSTSSDESSVNEAVEA